MRIILFLLDGKSYKWGSSVFDFGYITSFIYDLPKTTDDDAKIVFFTDDTSIIVTTSIQEGVQTV